VIESTGMFLDKAGGEKHLAAGAKKVILSAPSKDDTPMFVYGVNDKTYAGQAIISNASCTTNCLAPVAKVLQRQVGHQARPDDHGARRHRHAEDRGRPQQQGLARRPRHPGEHHPQQHRRGQGGGRGDPRAEQEAHRHVFRVPTSDVSVVDLTVELNKEATYKDICAEMKAQSEGALKGVLGYTEDKVVATDFRGETRTSVFDADAGIALDKHLRQGRELVRQRVGLLQQVPGDGARSHVPELGCPKPIRNQYRSDSDWSRYTADFLSYLETQESRVRELARYSRSATACLVCYEADFNLCHRTYVAREAQRKGAPLVKHLTARTAFLDQPLLAAA
jgi:hypothetical protein